MGPQHEGLGHPYLICLRKRLFEFDRKIVTNDFGYLRHGVNTRSGIVHSVFEGLHEIDWSSMHHAYGSAEEVPELLLALRSPDADTRRKALDRYYGAVHHQGTVYPCTSASLPFLYELVADPATADRAAIVELLVSIGSVAVKRGSSEHEAFVDLASDDDPAVRRAALPGLALFVDDPGPLRDRFARATEVPEQLVAVKAMGTLALRVPVLADETATWFATLAADPDAAAEVRLAALVQRVRCSPDRIDEDIVPTAIQLLALMTPAWTPSEPEPPAVPTDVPPHIAAAFADLARQGAVRGRTTQSLQALHEALAGRVQERTTLLTAQLQSPDLGTRLDGIPQCATLMRSWRGDHTSLILLLGEQLSVGEDELAAEAAAVLHKCHPIAEPARQALAAYLTHHGPAAWASPTPHVRRAYQESVQTLARLGDLRALPGLLWAMDNGVDAWRAAQVAGTLPTAADQLVPMLGRHLADLDLADPRQDSAASAVVSSLAALGDPAALPVLIATLRSSARQDHSSIMDSVLAALGTFGPAGTSALDTIRTFATADKTRSSAVKALWAVGRDSAEVLPLLHGLLHEGNPFEMADAADVLGEIGPPAEAAVPRLRELLTHNYEWVRIHAASALWDIVADETVLDTLLQAWTQTPATGNFVVSCLDRMGPAAAPALPELHAQLALPQRGGRFASIDNDEELQRVGHAIVARFETG
jgi:HEAT repeat protein